MSTNVQKPILVGEANPYGGDPQFALYPAPDGCSGHRLCTLILGMSRRSYLDSFERVNLCPQKWDARVAIASALRLEGRVGYPRFILLGAKVCRAFLVPFRPFTQRNTSARTQILILPHPSGLSRSWNDPNAVGRARRAMSEFCPELAHLIGASNRDERQPTRVGDDGVMEGK